MEKGERRGGEAGKRGIEERGGEKGGVRYKGVEAERKEGRMSEGVKRVERDNREYRERERAE